MHPPSILLTATARALHGASDPHVIEPALCNPRLACVLALAPNVHPVISALGALAGGLPDVIPSAGRDSPALHAAIASLIGTDAGARILPWWAEVAPAGWGASHAAALIDAVQRDRCPCWAAASLIGPTNDAAALLHRPQEIADAIRRWGQATSEDPTAWVDCLAETQRTRLLSALCADHDAAASCLPWLPEANASDVANNVVTHIKRTYRAADLPLALNPYVAALSLALNAYATAPPRRPHQACRYPVGAHPARQTA